MKQPALNASVPSTATSKKLNDEELEKCLQRLYEFPCEKKKKKQAEDTREIEENMHRNTCKPAKKEPSDKDISVCDRLYTQPLRLQKLKEESLEKKHLSGVAASQQKVLLTDEQSEEAIHRLYAQSMEHKKQVRAQSEKRIYGEAPAVRKLDSETLKENIKKLYSKAVETKKENHEKLEDKYIWKTDNSKKISKEQLNELVTRLGGTK